MRVYLGYPLRIVVNADLVRENFYTAWVRLRDGHIIKRHKRKHFVDYEADREIEKIEPIKVGKKYGFLYRLWNFIKNFFKTGE